MTTVGQNKWVWQVPYLPIMFPCTSAVSRMPDIKSQPMASVMAEKYVDFGWVTRKAPGL